MKPKSGMTVYLVYWSDGGIDDALFISAATPENAALLYVRDTVFEGEQEVTVEEVPIAARTECVHSTEVSQHYTVRRTIEVTLIDDPEPDEPNRQDVVVRLHPLVVNG